jgi:maltose O-acetyltransferase
LASEKEKMIAGLPYYPSDPELKADFNRTRVLLRRFNITEYRDLETYRGILSQLLPNCEDDIFIEPPFYCDYGYNMYAGHNVYLNFDCVVLDVCPINIGSNTMFGPGVHIYSATHPADASQRREGWEFGKPISIGVDCWIGGHATILPGVSIGNRCIVGAGAVVTRDVPDDSTAVGNPAECQTRQ